jgi:hypothetical protein
LAFYTCGEDRAGVSNQIKIETLPNGPTTSNTENWPTLLANVISNLSSETQLDYFAHRGLTTEKLSRPGIIPANHFSNKSVLKKKVQVV